MSAYCEQAHPREKSQVGGRVMLAHCLFSFHRALKLGWEEQIKEGVERMAEAMFPVLAFPKSGGSHLKVQGRNWWVFERNKMVPYTFTLLRRERT